MGTITARKRKDGTTGYKVQIILKSGGAIAHREARTFDRRQAANAWMVRRERELAEPGALERIKDASADPTLGRIIERYVAEHAKAMGSTKAGVLNSIKASNLAEMRCSAIGSADVIEKPRAGNLAIQGEEEARCCSTYRLTISNVAPPVEAAK